MKLINFNPRLYGFSIAIASIMAVSCNNDTGSSDEFNLSEEEMSQMKENSELAKKVFNALPSPMDMSVLLKEAGATFNKSYLNDNTAVSRYSTMSSKAINLGVYGADLSYSTIFDNTQEAMNYLNSVKTLADELGVTKAFDVDKIDRFEQNINNRDTVLAIVSQSFWITDAYLRENQRGNASALVLAGSWIEGVYIGTLVNKSLQETGNNQAVMQLIAEQKGSLNNLLTLLESYKQDESLATVTAGLNDIKTSYDKVEFIGEGDTTKYIEVSHLGEVQPVKFNAEVIDEISVKIEALRNKIIK